jgi:hypothetical protein
MLTALLWLGWSLLLLAVGGVVGYRWGYTDGWTDAGQTGYETVVDGGWLSREGGGERGE